jgi:hypothetical protein
MITHPMSRSPKRLEPALQGEGAVWRALGRVYVPKDRAGGGRNLSAQESPPTAASSITLTGSVASIGGIA